MNEDYDITYYVANLPKPPRVRFGNSDADQSEYGRFQSEHFVKVPTGMVWCYHVYEHAVVSWMGDQDGEWSDPMRTWFDKEKARNHWNDLIRRGGEVIHKRNTSEPVEMVGSKSFIPKDNWYKKYHDDAINAYQKANNLVSDKEWEEARLDPSKFYEEHLKGALSNYAQDNQYQKLRTRGMR